MADIIDFHEEAAKRSIATPMVEITVMDDGEIVLWVADELKSKVDRKWARDQVKNALKQMREKNWKNPENWHNIDG